MTSRTDRAFIEQELRRRAAALAGVPDAPRVGERLDVVEFQLAHEHYAIESHYVREVCALDQLAPVPCVPAFVLGLLNLRGEILSVLDLKRFFDLPERGITDLNKVLVLEAGPMRFGILADAIVGLRQILVADLQPPLPALAGVRDEYLRGVTASRLALLDGARLLNDPRIVVRDEVPA